jgi:hypothetical protein
VILLDTNVLSELMRPSPDPAVLPWLDGQAADELWISAVTVAEIRLGIALLPDSRRRGRLAELVEALFHEDFADRCLPFDAEAAVEYAAIVAARRQRGRPISVEDAQIAAIARSLGLTLATRNTADFANIDQLRVINPWST